MLKYLFSACILSSIVFASCTGKAEVDPDNASAITGTYKITKYVTEVATNNNPASGNNVVVTKIDKNTVKGQIVYSDGSKPVDANSLAITKSGSNYSLAKTYSNASANGSVSGNTLKLNINYDNGSYVQITAVK
jgi:hypothetical protein